MTAPAPDPTTELLAQLGWLRSLARRLVRSHDAADDLVQDACCAALAHRRGDDRPTQWRAWLATVVHNLAHATHRRDAARQHREEARAAMPDGGDAAELVQRAEAQQRLVGAVLALAEPYRATVLLRFFDGLPPRRIAARHGVPVATVHSRLQRALQQLREQLDARFGSRSGWMCVLVPVAWPSLVVPTPLGVLLMQTKTMLAAAAIAIACSVPLWWPAATAAADPDLATRSPKDVDTGGAGGRGSAGGTASRAPAAERTLAASPARDATPAAPSYRVDGRVCDCRGLAVAEVPIACGEAAAVVATSDAAGAFTFELTADEASLAAAGDRFVTVLRGDWSRDATIAPVVVVAGALALGGRVVDENGAPVTASEVTLQLPADFDARFPVPLDRTGRDRWQTRSRQDGTFRMPRVPGIDGAALMVTADAFAPGVLPLPPASDDNLQIVLKRFAFGGGELRGHVVDAAGAPAPGARVAMGVTSVVTDRDGAFGISLRRAGWPTAIVAAKTGYLPARVDVPRSGGTSPGEWPRDVVLRLGPAPKSARGRVVDQDGKGIAGSEVWIADPTPLGIAGLLPLHVEYLIAGGEVPTEAARMKVPFADDPTQDGRTTDSSSNAPVPTACWFFAKTDEQGAFEVPGLLDRPYTLRAIDPTTGLFGEAADVTGDSYREITIRREHVWPVLRGRVLSRRGEPLAGVGIEQQLVAFRSKARVPGGTYEGIARRRGRTATTGEDGTFELIDVGSRSCTFLLSGDRIVPSTVSADDVADPLHCELHVEARCHVEIVLLDPKEADQVACEDAAGGEVELAVLRRFSHQFETYLALHDGRSGLFVVGERAAKLLLRRDGAVVRTIPIVPDPSRTTTVQ